MTSETSFQPSLWDTPRSTFSQESESGHTPSGKLDGLTTDQSGQVPALANLSARQAKEQGLLTSGTSGQHSSTSLSSANLRLSLESRLRQRTDSIGSTLYTLTWKERVTPLRRSIFRRPLSVPHTFASASTS